MNRILAVACAAVGMLLRAGVVCGEEAQDFSVTPSLSAEYEMIYIGVSDVDPNAKKASGIASTTPADRIYLDGTWLHYIQATFHLSARFSDKLSASFGYSTFGGITNTNVAYVFGNPQKPPLSMKAGFFNYSYAPEVQDLGEYLFKTGVYPGFILSGMQGFDVLGVGFFSDIIPFVHQDLLVTSEIHIVPTFDFSLSYILRLFPDAFLSAGAGIQFYRLFSVDPKNTYPSERSQKLYDAKSGQWQSFYHAGTKAMARLTFDPKKLFQTNIFGPNDLKLYAEAAILGFKGYPDVQSISSYVIGPANDTIDTIYVNKFGETFSERAPFMIGLGVPTFKLLDVCAVEIEYYGSPYNNTITNQGLARPDDEFNQPDFAYRYLVDDIKWAVSLKKNVTQNYSISFRAARDHLRQKNTPQYPYTLGMGTGWYMPHELMVLPEHWYLSLTFSAHF